MSNSASIRCLVLLLMAAHALAWGDVGHSAIADVAVSMMSDASKAKMDSLLDGKPLSWYAPLPDDWDHVSINGVKTKACHFFTVRAASNGKVDVAHDCHGRLPQPRYCVISCLQMTVDDMRNTLTSCAGAPRLHSVKADRNHLVSDEVYPPPCDLELAVHYMGDLHQPLHVSRDGDTGGNDVEVVFGGDLDVLTPHNNRNRKSTPKLHPVWDSGLINYWLLQQHHKNLHDFSPLSAELLRIIEQNPDYKTKFAYQSDSDFVTWAQETYELGESITRVYDEDQSGRAIVDEAYYKKSMPVILLQLVKAGIRLGTLLDSVFGGDIAPSDPELRTFLNTNRARPDHMVPHSAAASASASASCGPSGSCATSNQREMTLYSSFTNQRLFRALVSAKLAGTKIKVVEYKADFAHDPTFRAYFPLGQTFAFITAEHQPLTGANAICEYIIKAGSNTTAANSLLGKSSPRVAARIATFEDLTNQVEAQYPPLVYPALGLAEYNEQTANAARSFFVSFMDQLDHVLSDLDRYYQQSFLASKELTFADISLASSLMPLYRFVFDESFRAPYVYANDWFVSVVGSPVFKEVLAQSAPALLDDQGSFRLLSHSTGIVN